MPSTAGAASRPGQPTYEAVLDEVCCLIRWDTRRTFCFYCWRKKLILILISDGSAGSYFSQRKVLEEKFQLHMAPRSVRFPCQKVDRGQPLADLTFHQFLAPLPLVRKWFAALSCVGKVLGAPAPKS